MSGIEHVKLKCLHCGREYPYEPFKDYCGPGCEIQGMRGTKIKATAEEARSEDKDTFQIHLPGEPVDTLYVWCKDGEHRVMLGKKCLATVGADGTITFHSKLIFDLDWEEADADGL